MNYSEYIERLLNNEEINLPVNNITIKFIPVFNTWVSTYLKTSIEYKIKPEDNWKKKEVNTLWKFKPSNKIETLNIIIPNTNNIYLKNLETPGWFNYIELTGKLLDLRKEHNISTINQNNGNIILNNTTYKAGDTVIINIQPNPDYELRSLYYIITSTSSKVIINSDDGKTYSFIMPDEDIIINAVFGKIYIPDTPINPDDLYTVTFNEILHGSVSIYNNDLYTVIINETQHGSIGIYNDDLYTVTFADFSNGSVTLFNDLYTVTFNETENGDISIYNENLFNVAINIIEHGTVIINND